MASSNAAARHSTGPSIPRGLHNCMMGILVRADGVCACALPDASATCRLAETAVSTNSPCVQRHSETRQQRRRQHATHGLRVACLGACFEP
eukprot:1433914-Prymnesium_polylepis.3